MKFEVDHVDYSVSEFFEVFKEKLPRIVTVTQGFHGDISDDIFDREGVYRIHTTSNQRRVAAKASDCHYSIPLNYPFKMCVVKKNDKVGKKQTLQEVLQKYDLPVKVRFASDQQLTVGSSVTIANRFPDLELTEMFDEIYFLANSIIDGDIYLQVVPIPLYLSKLRFAEVTGIKGKSSNVWSYFNKELSTLVTESVEFNTSYGNKDIAVYYKATLKPNETYYNLEPSKYERIYDVVQCSFECRHFVLPESNDIHTKEKRLSLSNVRNRPLPFLPDIIDNSTPDSSVKADMCTVEKDKNFADADMVENKLSSQEQNSATTSSHVISSDASSPFVSKPSDECYEQIFAVETNSVREPNELATPVFPQMSRPSPEAEDDLRSSPNNRRFEALKECSTRCPSLEMKKVLKPTNLTNESKIDIGSLSIKELARYMKILKLSRYISKFEKQRIDGVLLLELDTDILMEEFGMNKIEAVRLWRFIKDGHVPK